MQQILFNAYSAGNLVNRQSVIQAGEESTRNIKSYKPQKKLNYPVRLLFIGRKFVKEQTSSCEYHFQENVKKHSKYVNDTAQYYSLINAMKYATTTLQYEEKRKPWKNFSNSNRCQAERNWKASQRFGMKETSVRLLPIGFTPVVTFLDQVWPRRHTHK